jgi:hypothetical protein
MGTGRGSRAFAALTELAVGGLLALIVGCGGGSGDCPSTDAGADALEGGHVDASGMIEIMGSYMGCPNVVGLTVPASIDVGASAMVSGATDLAGGSAPTVKWTATSGQFLNPGQLSTFFGCSKPGPAIVTLTATANKCPVASLSATINCVPADAGF